MKARFLKPAEAEVQETIAYLDLQRENLGNRFEQELEASVNFVTEHPLSGKRLTGAVRKFPLRKFLYNLIYVVEESEIVIVAVAHHRRRPAYWIDRLIDLR
jgi:plasmid stabilization system protein ParE